MTKPRDLATLGGIFTQSSTAAWLSLNQASHLLYDPRL
jgi:hypothetical protein